MNNKLYLFNSVLKFSLFGLMLWSIPSGSVQAGTYISQNNGAWSTGTTWQGGSIPPTSGQEHSISIRSGHSITLDGNVSYGKELYLLVNGTLVVNGTFNVNKEMEITVNGTLIINGNFTADKEAELVINGTGSMEVNGNMSFAKEAMIELDGELKVSDDFTGAQENVIVGSGSLLVGGSISGFDLSGFNGTLPIELFAFTARSSAASVELAWQTITETNNDFFTLERSLDGVNYSEIGRVAGQGTSREPHSYDFTDSGPLTGVSYYRLRQTDFDGQTALYGPVRVTYSPVVAEEGARIWPNPLAGGPLHLQFDQPLQPESCSVRILNPSGTQVYAEVLAPEEGSSSTYVIDAVAGLPAGIYYLLVDLEGRLTRSKIIVR
jgi:hypothetical protein